jgi:uncharacterized protein (DUF1330 family)
MIHRYLLHVTLTVRDFKALTRFETEAAIVMKDHGGEITHAYETKRHADGSGTEVHIVEFKSETQFNNYRQDTRLTDLTELRLAAIENTDIQVITQIKNY